MIDDALAPADGQRKHRFGLTLACALGLLLSLVATPLVAQIPFEDAVQVAAGYRHTCALKADSTVQCWGDNSYGQLGDGTTSNRLMGVRVSGLTGVTAIAAGGGHTCAVTSSGAVWCWGGNFSGQLGDGTTASRLVPMNVSGLDAGAVAITAGDTHTCALTSAGAVMCWGENGDGQLGDGSTASSPVPVHVNGLGAGISEINAGYGHTCAVSSAGEAWCWGYNGSGQLGDGTTASSAMPVNVNGLGTDIRAITAGGHHTCALTLGGTALCWGNNGGGQLGDGGTESSLAPVNVSGPGAHISEITAGGFHTCALTTEGAALCWGDGVAGQLGNGRTTYSPLPVDVDVSDFDAEVSSITAGDSHTCARALGGSVWCWGGSPTGQAGDGVSANRAKPTTVRGLGASPLTVAVGISHSCALTADGMVWCWGDNSFGQLGDGTTTSRLAGVRVNGLTAVVAISAGGHHTCALTSGGVVQCWGANWFGQLGDGGTSTSLVPVVVSDLGSSAIAITAGNAHTCAVTTGGTAWCWGANVDGSLGDGSTESSSLPVNVTGLGSGISAIAAGYSHTCALTSGGAVRCWGSNFNGQLGDGGTTDSLVAVNVSGLGSGVSAITAGYSHTCAVTSGGGALCWGYNWFGQLGNGSGTSSTVPVDVSGLDTGVSAMTAGFFHTCALTSGGAMRCWGYNSSGRLGDGGTTSSPVPVNVIGLGAGVSAITAGYSHTCAAISGGAALCWGKNDLGQIGDGTRSMQPSPVQALQTDPMFIFDSGFE